MVAILDYGIGNLKSVYNMFKKVGIESVITSDSTVIKNADKYLLSGVGSFDHGISSLKDMDFFDTFEKEVLEHKKPVLGICLGMQLLTKASDEGKQSGLGWIDAKSVEFKLSDKSLAIPHMGWNKVYPKEHSILFEGLQDNKFYFVHSYHVVCNDKNNESAIAKYGQDFVCSINKENIYGVQFHPEKSHKFGMKLLKNFGGLS